MVHRHEWQYEDVIWKGSKPHGALVARYCQCGAVQTAETVTWKTYKAPK